MNMCKEQQSITSFSKRFVIGISLLVLLLLLSLVLLLLFIFYPRPTAIMAQSEQIVTSTFSPDQYEHFLTLKEFLNLSSTYPTWISSRSTSNMQEYMREKYFQSTDDLSDVLISLPNQARSSHSKRILYHFQYNSSLESLINVELILPLRRHSLSLIQLTSPMFNEIISSTCQIDRHWCRINLTRYITTFPLRFILSVSDPQEPSTFLSSGFLTLKFRQAFHSPSEQTTITYTDDPSHCQVRPFRLSLETFHWSSWIIEPRAYEMNMCSGTCHTGSNMATYSVIQNFLHQRSPKIIPAPCCRPKRFSSTLFLYYDGSNLVLKRHEKTRVVECLCSF